MTELLKRYKNGQFRKKRPLQLESDQSFANKKKKTEKICVSNPEPIIEGRRIVDINKIAVDMWCDVCDDALSFRFIKNEDVVGLSSLFSIECHRCKKIHMIKTSPQTPTGNYVVNGKAAMAILTSGIGITHLNSILVYLNIPTVYHTLLKRYEREVGINIEKVAKDSCRDSVEIERNLTIAHNSYSKSSELISDDDIVEITVSVDAGWQKKGSGRTYNSLTGHSTTIGHLSGLILGYSTRNKRCAMCQRGHEKDDHDCRENFSGSSKAMEPDMAVEMLLHNEDFVAQRTLTTPVIQYLKYCFRCSLKSNQGNVETSRQALLNIIPHAFDDHTNCKEWCGFHKNPEKYEHKLLPGGKGLTGDNLKYSLEKIFRNFANNVEQLAPCGSSQANESMNMKIASKAPKARHYGGSESNDFRVATAVCEKNVGFCFIKNFNQEMGYSPPTKHSLKFLEQKDNLKRLRAAETNTVAAKKKRRELFTSRTKSNTKAQNREGICYQSQSGLDIGTEFVDQPVPKSSITKDETVAAVFFDLETTGFGQSCEIIQIAAMYNDTEYNVYILPTRGIPPSASAVTGLTTNGGKLFLLGIEVETVSAKLATEGLLSFLKSTKQKNILIAHNCIRFDAPLIIRLMKQVDLLTEFRGIVSGFCDTLPLFKSKLPERKSKKLSFKQSALAEEFLEADDLKNAHNAINDVSVLQKLVYHAKIKITHDELKLNTVTINYIAYLQSKSNITNKLLSELRVLVKSVTKNNSHDNKNSKKNSSGLSANMACIACGCLTNSHHESYLTRPPIPAIPGNKETLTEMGLGNGAPMVPDFSSGELLA
ncbi:uncharacterized protein LOC130673868 [Microplitis mediator]|uniref:uncharacterized protein LOC130673868 n=1 Tax=Microplitis mediator TaxID=375433 RepID=UPI00255626C5|nr:uncharacterized protein LOC130673868 [Microplitis mediator]